MTELTRRHFLKLAGGAAFAAAALPFVSPVRLYAAKLPPGENLLPGQLTSPLTAPPASLGRIATYSVAVYTEATRQSTLVRQAHRDDILSLYGQIVGEAVTSYNAIWYQTDGGYVHSAWVQPV